MIWFIIGLVCVLAEFAAPGVVLVFFGVGAWLVALLLLVTDINVLVQSLIFVTVSFTSLLLMRKHVVKQREITEDETDDFIGGTAQVLKPFSKGTFGSVKFKGASWKAKTESETMLEEGDNVTIIGHESIMLIVRDAEKNNHPN